MSVAKMDVVESTKAYWVKASVDRRRAHLIKQGCDDSWVNSLSNEQLVEKILVIAGFVDGDVVKTKAPSLDKGTAELLVFMQQEAARAETRRREEAERLEARRREEVEQAR